MWVATTGAERATGTTWAEWETMVVSLGPVITVPAVRGWASTAACGVATKPGLARGITPPYAEQMARAVTTRITWELR